nr:family 10 glycosylhydrolase [uncultured Carboxylicivirga sp.]
MKRCIVLIQFVFLTTVLLYAGKYPKREMRAVWIATVANIDWPSRAGLTTDMQQEEMIELLDLAKEYHFNTVIFQIRPSTDAFYQSSFEPWSQWLTGKQGKAPDPFYDPLEFTIKECRKRGLDIHVWMNPYRAVFDTAKSSIAESNPVKSNPEWFVTYGSKAYFNPGLPETRNHVCNVVADILRRYEIDAIHFDDYFYPYRISGKDFPDQQAFELYPRGFSTNEKENWRRDNVDLIIKQLHDTIKAVTPYVEFGISPFGVWRNNDKDPRGSATKAGQTNYDDLYADVLKWQQEGWIDYVTPQIYWPIGKKVADYAVLVDWWDKNAFGCPLYIGHGLYRLDAKSGEKAWQKSKEMDKQVKLLRKYENVEGSMFFSAKYMRTNPLGFKQRMQKKHYRYVALPPKNIRVTQIMPERPENAQWDVKNDTISLSWNAGENNVGYIIYKCKKSKELKLDDVRSIVAVTGDTELKFKLDDQNSPYKYDYIITGISITNNESNGVIFR